MANIKSSGRVAIIGAGQVGSSIAYAVLNQEIAREILILDIAQELAEAQVMDLQDSAVMTGGVTVKFADYSDLQDGDLVVISCGAAQQPGQTRLDLLEINAKIINAVCSQIKNTGKKVYCLMVTNPVDILTYVANRVLETESGLVFGSGTLLDSLRLRVALAEELQMPVQEIIAYTIGEHGDSSVDVLSNVRSRDGEDLTPRLALTPEKAARLSEIVREKAQQIIAGKKATYYGIGTVVSQIAKAIIRNQKIIQPLSVILHGEYGLFDVALGVPASLDESGVELTGELSLNAEEKAGLEASAKVLADNLRALNEKLPELV